MTFDSIASSIEAAEATELSRSGSPELRDRLAAVDWSFTLRERAPAIEAVHPYPAKFIGEIPRSLLDVLPVQSGTVVFDPFVGSGTTLVEAQRRGLSSVGIDLNPIACLAARVKTSEVPPQLLDVARHLTARARERPAQHRPNIPNVDHWFKSSVQEAITSLVAEIDEISGEKLQDALRLALSSILVRVSNQDSDTRYAAVEKQVNGEGVYAQFLVACDKLHRALLSRDWKLLPARIIQANTLTLTADALNAPAGIVITSPPYPNAYEYWLYHKYRMWWLGFDPIAVKEQEIGARAHFFKRAHHTEEHFWSQMRQTFKLIDEVLVSRGFACFVIGRSKIHGRLVDNAEIIRAIAAERDFQLVARIERPISANRKSFNLSHANIKTESVVVLQKKH